MLCKTLCCSNNGEQLCSLMCDPWTKYWDRESFHEGSWWDWAWADIEGAESNLVSIQNRGDLAISILSYIISHVKLNTKIGNKKKVCKNMVNESTGHPLWIPELEKCLETWQHRINCTTFNIFDHIRGHYSMPPQLAEDVCALKSVPGSCLLSIFLIAYSSPAGVVIDLHKGWWWRRWSPRRGSCYTWPTSTYNPLLIVKRFMILMADIKMLDILYNVLNMFSIRV